MSTVSHSLYPWRKLIATLATLLFILPLLTACSTASNPLAIQQVVPPLLDGGGAPLQVGTSLWVLNQFAKSSPNAFALQSPTSLITWFAAPLNDLKGWATVALNLHMREPVEKMILCDGGGTFYQCKDMATLVETALAKGWNFVYIKDMPQEFPAWLATSSSWLYKISTSVHMPVLVIPVDMFDLSKYIKPVQSEIKS